MAETDSAVSLGSELRKAREASGLKIDYIYAATKIQKKYIEAMESGNLEELPKGPFGRAFIKQYCELLDLEELWKQYKSLLNEQRVPVSIPTGDASENSVFSDNRVIMRRKSHTVSVIVVIVCIVLAGWVTFKFRGEIYSDATSPIDGGTMPTIAENISEDESTASIDLGWMDGKPVKETQPQETRPQETLPQETQTQESRAQDAQETPAASDVGGANDNADITTQPSRVLRIIPHGIVWIKATTAGKTLYEGLINPGEIKEFISEGTEPLRVVYGNEGSTSFSWNGSEETTVGPQARKRTVRFYWPDGRITNEQ